MDKSKLLETWLDLKGKNLGKSPWYTLDQGRISAFAEATRDFQPIHVDPESPNTKALGGTIAHGFFSLSMLPHLNESLVTKHFSDHAVLNYGLNRVRFIAPVPSGSDIRLELTVNDVEEKTKGVLLTLGSTVEIRDIVKPALVAEQLALVLAN